jgi:hypothetical protein
MDAQAIDQWSCVRVSILPIGKVSGAGGFVKELQRIHGIPSSDPSKLMLQFLGTHPRTGGCHPVLPNPLGPPNRAPLECPFEPGDSFVEEP